MADSFAIRDRRNAGHHWADNEVLDDFGKRIGAYGYAVYMFICRYAGNQDGRCYKTQREIADTFGVSMDTVGRSIKTLIDCGLLRREQKAGRPCVYVVLEVPKKWRNNLPLTAASPNAHSGNHLPPTADTLPPTAVGLPLTAARNKEVRLSQDFSLNGGGAPAHRDPRQENLDTADRKRLQDWIEVLSPHVGTYIPNKDAELFQRLKKAAEKSALSYTRTKELLRVYDAYRNWKWLDYLDSQQEIEFPQEATA